MSDLATALARDCHRGNIICPIPRWHEANDGICIRYAIIKYTRSRISGRCHRCWPNLDDTKLGDSDGINLNGHERA